MSEIEPEQDPPPDADAQAAIAKLTEADIRIIDDCILSNITPRLQKTAMIVARTMRALEEQFPNLPDVFYSGRIKHLAASRRDSIRGQPGQIAFQRSAPGRQHLRSCTPRSLTPSPEGTLTTCSPARQCREKIGKFPSPLQGTATH